MTDRWRIKKGDMVHVMTGKSAGVQGAVLKVNRDERTVIVQGANIAKKHQKPAAGNPGGIIEKEMPIHASNLMHVDPVKKVPTRIGVKFLEDGRKVRFAKKSGELLD